MKKISYIIVVIMTVKNIIFGRMFVKTKMVSLIVVFISSIKIESRDAIWW